jgi:hypothetical protein
MDGTTNDLYGMVRTLSLSALPEILENIRQGAAKKLISTKNTFMSPFSHCKDHFISSIELSQASGFECLFTNLHLSRYNLHCQGYCNVRI